jgi:hypothetical protein
MVAKLILSPTTKLLSPTKKVAKLISPTKKEAKLISPPTNEIFNLSSRK